MQISMNALRELMNVKMSVRISLVVIVAAAHVKDTDFRLMEPHAEVSILALLISAWSDLIIQIRQRHAYFH